MAHPTQASLHPTSPGYPSATPLPRYPATPLPQFPQFPQFPPCPPIPPTTPLPHPAPRALARAFSNWRQPRPAFPPLPGQPIGTGTVLGPPRGPPPPGTVQRTYLTRPGILQRGPAPHPPLASGGEALALFLRAPPRHHTVSPQAAAAQPPGARAAPDGGPGGSHQMPRGTSESPPAPAVAETTPWFRSLGRGGAGCGARGSGRLREVPRVSLAGGSRLSCSRAIWLMEPAVSTVPWAGQGPHRGWGAPSCPATVGSTSGPGVPLSSALAGAPGR